MPPLQDMSSLNELNVWSLSRVMEWTCYFSGIKEKKKKKKPLDEQIMHEGMSSQMIPSNLH